jgi:lactoylglutathione lyase
MSRAKKVIHTCVWISNIEDTKSFYIEGLGLNHTWGFTGGDGVENFYIAGEEGGAEIQFKYRPNEEGKPEQEVIVERKGMDHLALSVQDVNETVEEMVKKTGCNIVIGPFQNDETGVRAAFIEDPDGYVVELVQYLESGTNSKI